MGWGPLSFLQRGEHVGDDPYWDAFMRRAPHDPSNSVPQGFQGLREGGVNPTRSEIHSPNVEATHIKELGRFFGAHDVGIVELNHDPFPPDAEHEANGNAEPSRFFAIMSALKADDDVAHAAGIGGQTPAMKGLFATFCLAAYVRELGYRATRVEADRERLGMAARLVSRSASGALTSPRLGPHPYIAEVIVTDLPLEADGQEAHP